MGAGGDDKADMPGLPGVPLDTAAAQREILLLKVPTALAKVWQQQRDAGSTEPLARLTSTWDLLNPNSPPEFSMEVPGKDGELPKKYVLPTAKDLVPMCIFTETTDGKLAAEGRVKHKFDMQRSGQDPDEYRKICRDRLTKSMVKQRTLQVLSEDGGRYMRPQPGTWHAGTKDKKKSVVPAKGTEGKRIRGDRTQLEDMVFQLFEQTPNWGLKNLTQATAQPVAFLKEVLNELCIYNKRGLNQGTYELKPEYKRMAAEAAPAAPPTG